MSRDLSRLLRPRSVAVIGGGAWCAQVVVQLKAMGFDGDIWRVHPDPAPIEGIAAVPSVADLPGVPDAAYVAVNRHLSVGIVAALAEAGTGGAVCFASGFAEASREDATASDLQAALVKAAGHMPILGPNCYGFINALDGVLLWPDQHGCAPVESGVGIITQSSNIAINLTMQLRGLPIACVVTCGNMAQTSQAEIALALLDDPRITAIGLHIEGFGDGTQWHVVALKARNKGVPLVALKVGASVQARQATVSHTASLAGSDTGASAFLRRLGIARLHDLPSFLETLKLLHVTGALESNAMSCISCSGGEASLVADAAEGLSLSLPSLSACQKAALHDALGSLVALSNPLDYHTYIWGDADRMVAAWLPMAADHIGLVMLIIDYPHTDASAWDCATQAAIALRRISERPVAVVATLPELMPRAVAARFLAAGVTPICGLREAMMAAEAAANMGTPHRLPLLVPKAAGPLALVGEAEAKDLLKAHGVHVPRGVVLASFDDPGPAGDLSPPLALKGRGLAHKSEAGAVALNLSHDCLAHAAEPMAAESFLVEEMILGVVAELLVGVTRDPAHGFLLTIAAGGVMTELWQDSVSLLLPVTAADVADGLAQLRTYPLLTGYRGKPRADIAAITSAILALQVCVVAHADTIHEIEINPLICTSDSAVAADALITMAAPSMQKEM
ncbi:MAG: acetate--CoA ligase family protein [Paracoccaceae bacterium]|nr:acetate--CoA ligase family protein [Paracoccaceae bacterium]